MNKIIESSLNEHIKEYSIENYEENDAFEHFINRCIITKYVSDRFDPNLTMTGPGEVGLDGIAIVINSQLITNIDEVESILKNATTADIRFIFIQTKRSNSFNNGEMETFVSGVKYFFNYDNANYKMNDKIEILMKIKEYIYSKVVEYERKPYLHLYYACCGKWYDDNNLSVHVNTAKRNLSDRGDFENVEYIQIDNDKIIELYKELRRKIKKTFKMEKRLSFPEMKGVREAYFGLVKCKDIVEILSDVTGKLFGNIFEDNVRDFQGYNAVNTEIKNTLNSDSQERFAVLNNGITIIAKNIETAGDKISIFDYQVVNGCQTSHVLFDNAKIIHDNSYVLTKIICVENEDFLDEIVYTSNRQTEVKSEAFSSSRKFHKCLQDYYNAMIKNHGLYYERRSKQYDMDSTVNKNNLVTLAAQTKDYVAMFLNEPHSIHRYYGEILESYKKRIYGDDDAPEPYYVSAYTYYIVDKKAKSGMIPKELKNFKYHICYLLRVLICGEEIVYANSKKIKKNAELIEKSLDDDDDVSRKIDTVCTCIMNVKNKENGNEEYLLRSKDFTQKITNEIKTFQEKSDSKLFLKKNDIVVCLITAINKEIISVEIKSNDNRRHGQVKKCKMSGDEKNIINKYKIGDKINCKIINECKSSKYQWELSFIMN